ncbi:uncharacterized protein LOC110092415 [Dendrobium catenatum]|uniref:Protein NUCLEAR FUSION DEFECTIVE 6, chloroplastic/mitochondrial n=1 Tax=Dendrobium catenatum TaxID=906689 RepID=A0A2I0XGW1_9ASPA|nr:uncharacterized protein LOC110092415 [Dendrobium catenatum]PKU87149.1 hypothetical protein MA16_Dca006558 [Dendrobium catenatum]
MASICRSAVMAAARSVPIRSKAVFPKTSPSRRTAIFCRPLVPALGGVYSLIPLHSAIASARLISNIAVDTSCWSWVSQGLASPS